MDLHLRPLDHVQLGKPVVPQMSYYSSALSFPVGLWVTKSWLSHVPDVACVKMFATKMLNLVECINTSKPVNFTCAN